MKDLILAIIWKDLKRELSSKETSVTMLMFILLVIFAFRFAFGEEPLGPELIASIIWSAFLFAGLFTLFNSFAKEKDTRCLEGLLLCPGDRGAIYLGKMISNLIQVYILEAIGIGMMEVFFRFEIFARWPLLFFILFLGTLALVAVGTITSAISIRARGREMVLPVLFIPLVLLTVIVPSVSLTSGVLAGGSLSTYSGYLNVLGGFSVIYVALALLLFDEVIIR